MKEKSTEIIFLDFDQTVTKDHSFETNNAAAMAGMPEDAIVKRGIEKCEKNCRPGIPKALYDMSGNKICAVVTHHNNYLFIGGFFMKLMGEKTILKTKIFPHPKIPSIAIAAFYFESQPKPLYICHIREKGIFFQQARKSLHGKNEMITFVLETLFKEGWAAKDIPATYYDDDLVNIEYARSLQGVKAIQVSVSNPEFELLQTTSGSPKRASGYLSSQSEPKVEARDPLFTELAQIIEDSRESKEFKETLPFAVPIMLNKPKVGESWYLLFSNMDAAGNYLLKNRGVKNSYTHAHTVWHNGLSLRGLAASAGDFYRYDATDETRTLLYKSWGAVLNDNTVIMEINPGIIKRWVEENRKNNTKKAKPPTDLLSPLSRLSPEKNKFFRPLVLTKQSEIEEKIAQLVTEKPELIMQLSVLKDLAVIQKAIPAWGQECLLFNAQDIMLECIEVLRALGAKPVVVYESIYNFDEKISCLDFIPPNLGEYYRYINNAQTVIDGNNEVHANVFMVELSPGAMNLFFSAKEYIEAQATHRVVTDFSHF